MLHIYQNILFDQSKNWVVTFSQCNNSCTSEGVRNLVEDEKEKEVDAGEAGSGKVAKLRIARLKARREITVGKGKIMATPRLAKGDTLLPPTTLRGWPRTSLSGQTMYATINELSQECIVLLRDAEGAFRMGEREGKCRERGNGGSSAWHFPAGVRKERLSHSANYCPIKL